MACPLGSRLRPNARATSTPPASTPSTPSERASCCKRPACPAAEAAHDAAAHPLRPPGRRSDRCPTGAGGRASPAASTWNGRSGCQPPTAAKQYDLTLISHVEPLDLGNYAKPDYYWATQSSGFNALYATHPGQRQPRRAPAAPGRCPAPAGRRSCERLFVPTAWITIAKTGLRGLWRDMPIAVNDLSSLGWA